MGEAWYPGADRSRPASSDGGSILGGKPKLLWHDTESSGLPSYSSGSFPHFTLDPESGKVWQHIPANRAARALRNPEGGCQTNRWNVLQVELIGYVNRIPYHAAMGELAAWALREWNVPPSCGVGLLAYDASYGNTSVRLSCAEWDGYSGHCYHMSAPENDHGDPGKPFPIDQILAAAGGEDDVTPEEALAQSRKALVTTTGMDVAGGSLFSKTADIQGGVDRMEPLLNQVNGKLDQLLAILQPGKGGEGAE
jgi:hypothetical protein